MFYLIVLHSSVRYPAVVESPVSAGVYVMLDTDSFKGREVMQGGAGGLITNQSSCASSVLFAAVIWRPQSVIWPHVHVYKRDGAVRQCYGMFCRRVDCAIIYGARMAFSVCTGGRGGRGILAAERRCIVSLLQLSGVLCASRPEIVHRAVMLYVSRPMLCELLNGGVLLLLLLVRPIVARCDVGFASGQADSLERNRGSAGLRCRHGCWQLSG